MSCRAGGQERHGPPVRLPCKLSDVMTFPTVFPHPLQAASYRLRSLVLHGISTSLPVHHYCQNPTQAVHPTDYLPSRRGPTPSFTTTGEPPPQVTDPCDIPTATELRRQAPNLRDPSKAVHPPPCASPNHMSIPGSHLPATWYRSRAGSASDTRLGRVAQRRQVLPDGVPRVEQGL